MNPRAELETIRERIEVSLFDIEQRHHVHGHECLCGFTSARARSRTEHITGLVRDAITTALEGK